LKGGRLAMAEAIRGLRDLAAPMASLFEEPSSTKSLLMAVTTNRYART
jgi:hypothetical protein